MANNGYSWLTMYSIKKNHSPRLIARHLRAERAGTAADEVAEELRRAGAAQWRVDETEKLTWTNGVIYLPIISYHDLGL